MVCIIFLIVILVNFTWISCFPHIVNLACKAMLNNMSELDSNQDLIGKLHRIIRHISFVLSGK